MPDSGGLLEESQPALAPGTRLGKYEIGRLLGAGGMGAVYEASHTEIGKRVAIKVLSPAISAVPGARTRFLREAQLTSRVRHPNIVDVTDMGSEGGQTYLVMELLRGEDLAQRVARSGPLSAQDLADILLPVCSAVVEAHHAGVTHRDLKPQNIFLAEGPHTTQPKVLDFGISKANDVAGAGTLTGTGAMIGTPFYLAPEQIMDTRSAGPQSDQYALGVIMYECLTGQRPYEAENLFVVFQAIVAGKALAPRQLRPDIPSRLEEIVLRAMNVDPKARFASTRALGRSLLEFASTRVRSIWEEVFTVPGDENEARAIEEAPVPSLSGGTKVMTPAADDPESWKRVKKSLERRPGRAVESPPEEVVDTLDLFGRVEARSRHFKVAGVIGGVAVLGLIVTLIATGGTSEPDRRFTKRPSPPVAVEPSPSEAQPLSPVSTRSMPAVPAPGGVEGQPDPDPASPRQRPEADRTSQPPSDTEGVASTPVVSPPAGGARPATLMVAITVRPSFASIELDGQPAGQGHLERALSLDHEIHRLRLTANGYEEQVLEFADEPPPTRVTLTRIRRLPRLDPESAPSPGNTPDDSRDVPRRPFSPAPRPSSPSLNPNGAPVID